ncbi:Uncharacterised protein [Acinetobacter baumannii]|nr:Uncharacterised protein [Acinetobacter baumannii]
MLHVLVVTLKLVKSFKLKQQKYLALKLVKVLKIQLLNLLR